MATRRGTLPGTPRDSGHANGAALFAGLLLLALAAGAIILDSSSDLPSNHGRPSRAQYLEHPSATQLQGKLRAPAPPTPPPPADGTLPFLEALAQCDTLECLRHAHAQPRAHPTFNFPHFLVIGFQKAATTSLFGHLTSHPQVLPPSIKEPEFFTNGCRYSPARCPAAAQRAYIRRTLRLDAFLAANGTLAPFEGSTHYVRSADKLARPLMQALPWVKIVVSLREPVSRAISMLVHNKERNAHGCLASRPLGDCLLGDSQVAGGDGAGAPPRNYSRPLAAWLRECGRGRMHVIQYEELTSAEGEAGALRRVKAFLGLDPSLPAGQGLLLTNSRRFKIQPQGWAVPVQQYKQLVAAARRDAEELIALLGAHGQLRDDGGAWMARWERVWKDNLATCDGGGVCTISLS